MHFDRFGDVSKLIYLGMSSPGSAGEDSISSPLNSETRELAPAAERESGTLNYYKQNPIPQLPEAPQHQELSTSSDSIRDRLGKQLPTQNGVAKEESEEKLFQNGGDCDNNNVDELLCAIAEYDKKEDEMKDLDRLVQDLLQEASQIPDIPYHAREDGLPFRYCAQDDIVKHRGKFGGHSHQRNYSVEDQEEPEEPSFSGVPTYATVSKKHGDVSTSNHNTESSINYLPRNWNCPNEENGGGQRSTGGLQGSSASNSPLRSNNVAANSLYSHSHEPHSSKSSTRDIRKYELEPTSRDTVEAGYVSKPREYRVPITVQQSSGNCDRSAEIPIPIHREVSSAGGEQEWPELQDMRKQQRDLESEFKKFDEVVESTRSKERTPVKYSRSHSADSFGGGGGESEDWLAKQMAKLELKRSRSIRRPNLMTGNRGDGTPPAWLAELRQRNKNKKSSESITLVDSPTEFRIPFQTEPSSPPPKLQPVEYQIPIIHQLSEQHQHQQQQKPVVEKKDSFKLQQKADAEAPSSLSNKPVSDNVDSPTPRFPSCPPTPYMNRSALRKADSFSQRNPTGATGGGERIARFHSFRKRRGSTDDESEGDEDFARATMSRRQEDDGTKFTLDNTANWYKPSATREETISALTNREPGTFLIRNSNSFPGAFGLAIKVDSQNIRHFLIEPTRAGVRLRGSDVEPVFGSLSALVYAHTIEPLALPVKLKLPPEDNLIPTTWSQSTTSTLLKQGAACQLLFFGEHNVETLTGAEAIQRSVTKLYMARPTKVNLRLSNGGLVLTDLARERFFRQHYHLSTILHAGIDPSARTITVEVGNHLRKFFGIVVTKGTHNCVLVLSEFEEGQPAVAIVSFIMRVLQWRSF